MERPEQPVHPGLPDGPDGHCHCHLRRKVPQVAKLLNKIAVLVNTRTAALIVLMIFGYVTSMLNWAFCTIVTPFWPCTWQSASKVSTSP